MGQRAAIPKTPPEELRQRMHYNPGTGALTWIMPLCPRIEVGASVGTARADGYVFCKIRGDRIPKGRIIWAWMTGEWPPVEAEIDHRDGHPENYVWGNLRCATFAQNASNRQHQKNNTAGHPGIRKIGRRWNARIWSQGKAHHLGMFATKEDAIAAYDTAATELHGDFRRKPPHGAARWQDDAPGVTLQPGEPAEHP